MCIRDSLNGAELERGILRGTALGDAVNLARRLAITPSNLMTPTHLAEEATKVAERNGLEIDVLDEARASREGMAVSYTHLDVYKRQQRRRSGRPACGGVVLCAMKWGGSRRVAAQ